jgi:endonuclease/exonuclease/phosphatase family metal-dependent hydrolase
MTTGHMDERIFICGLGLLTAGCATLPTARMVNCTDAPSATIETSADGRIASTLLDVLTYNIEGLPWPARSNRGPYLAEIGERLAALRAEGDAPDIIVFQEVFSRAATRAVESTGYRSMVAGPGRRSRQAPNAEGALPGERRILRGEIGANLLSSGLVVATDFPIVADEYQSFGRGSCAGFDCLSNKGALFAQVVIPGIPEAIDVFTTHMQAQRASGVPKERHLEAHLRQTRELSEFVSVTGNRTTPTIAGGDFNLRGADTRQYHFNRKFPVDNVHRFCIEQPDECEVLEDWPHEEQWRRVQNMQLFTSGNIVTVRPVRAEGMFDGGPSGPVLSDHNGFRVTYQLSWSTSAVAPSLCAPAPLAP